MKLCRTDGALRRPAWSEIISIFVDTNDVKPLGFWAIRIPGMRRLVKRSCIGPLSDVLGKGLNEGLASSPRIIGFIPALRHLYDMLMTEGASSAGYVREQSMQGTASVEAIRHNYCLMAIQHGEDSRLLPWWRGTGLLASLTPPTVDQ